jgi:hypothetical protein
LSVGCRPDWRVMVAAGRSRYRFDLAEVREQLRRREGRD